MNYNPDEDHDSYTERQIDRADYLRTERKDREMEELWAKSRESRVESQVEESEPEGETPCEHEWLFCDDSFDHEFGTEKIPPYEICIICDERRAYEAPEDDHDEDDFLD